MTRDQLIAALVRHRDNDVRLNLHGVRIDVGEVRFANGDAFDEIQIVGADLNPPLLRVVLHAEPDDTAIDIVVEELRDLWAGHSTSGRRTPDFHRWAKSLIRRLEFLGKLPTVDAPQDAEVAQ